MSKMNLKSTLWTLAFAVAAVSCSDELEEGGGTSTGNEENGEGVYLTVNIASSFTGAMTKADPDVEDGDEPGNTDPQGTVDERKVHDVNIYLIKADANTGEAAITQGTEAEELKSVNVAEGTTINIVGHGYSSDIDEGGEVDGHTANSVLIEIDTDQLTDAGQIYHVLAVTNLGTSKEFTKLNALRDELQKQIWTIDNNGTYPEYGKTKKFVMSTHQMYGSQGGSSVTISKANTNISNPATTTVYVERLAARIDLQVASGLVSNTGATVTTPVSKEGDDYIQLTGYQVVNRWNDNTNMLKRVSQNATEVEGIYPLPSPLTEYYLYDEKWVSTTNTYNYVISPDMATKKAEDDGTINGTLVAKYDGHYDANLNDKITTDFKSIFGISTKTGNFTPIVYTKENTLDLNNQIYGLMTGVIFKGTYKPSKYSKLKDDYSAVETPTYTSGDFCVVNDFFNGDKRYLCADLATVGALGFPQGDMGDPMTEIINSLFNPSANSWGVNTDIDDLKKAVNGMISAGALNAAYKAFLDGKLESVTDINSINVSDVNWNAFLTSIGLDGTLTVDDIEKLSKDYNVYYYQGGTCYYPYWIRHANNGDNNVMGPMEFCIVRNNVYQLGVSGVNAIGYPLPFVEPEDTGGESKEVFLTVELYVKNWVVRSNSGIVL